MATNAQARLTAHDYLIMTPPDDFFHELIGGILYKNPSRTPEHQLVLQSIAHDLYDFVKVNGLGKVIISPMDVFLSDEDVLKPDLLFISKERKSIIGNWVYAAPDLVIEVLERVYPETAERDRGVKLERYAQFGVRECWMVDLFSSKIEVLGACDDDFAVLGVYGEGEVLESPLLAGLQVDISGVFESAKI